MRQLLAKDIAPFTKLLAKMELKETIKGMFKNSTEKGEMVSELIWGIVENYDKVEKELFIFLAGLQEEETSTTVIENMPLPEFIELLRELFSEKNLSFFSSAAKLTQRK